MGFSCLGANLGLQKLQSPKPCTLKPKQKEATALNKKNLNPKAFESQSLGFFSDAFWDFRLDSWGVDSLRPEVPVLKP